MWNKSKSLTLTVLWVRLALIVWLILFPTVFFMDVDAGIFAFFCLLFLPVLTALYGLDRLLYNIKRGILFSEQNIGYFRLISWACFFSAVFLLAGACLWPVLVFASGAIGFLGLFIRVIKNMIAEAVELKHENDYTI